MSDNDVMDRRQARTRRAIREAFIALLFERKYEAVTLVQVAARADVGRSTLYEHFRTKADLLRDSLQPVMAALASVIGSRDVPAQLAWWLQHMRERQAFARVLLHHQGRDLLQPMLAEAVQARLDKLEAADEASVPADLLARQIAAAQFAILSPWVLGQMALTSAELAGMLHITSRALVRSAFIAP